MSIMLYTEYTIRFRALSSSGRAPDLHSGGDRFKSGRVHQNCIADAPVVQLVEAPDLGSGCWGFESLLGHHLYSKVGYQSGQWHGLQNRRFVGSSPTPTSKYDGP